jgi:hypothetical protein
MSTSIDAADCELSRLLELERRDVADAGGFLRWRLGAARPEYLVMRADMAKVMSRVALFYKAVWDAAHLGMALLDMMMILLLFLQKQNLAFAVYQFGSVLSLPD